ncbi:polysaccharide biosynthesis C-terminal domain-containing protein [Prevotella bryantii]|uniref:polysaccharide biosynthesis C-terminal domain-containing protein n=2 Tax=Segatella bryantii TaxID=77095 RepID=UPI002853583A|nr:polysaccharide biosynthesis C-terminal domain-containing protein [Segatella bryantii]MDR4932225.1 polysaccharide biosynthesis C-terminal domain-containing protein [Segatella bryantii]
MVAPIILVVSFSGFLGTQTLYPMGKVKIIIVCTFIGAVTDLILNILLMPSYSYNAAAISYLGAEIATSLSMFLIAHKMIPVSYFNKDVLLYSVSAILMGIGLFLMTFIHMEDFIQLLSMFIVGLIIYIGMLMLKRDAFA